MKKYIVLLIILVGLGLSWAQHVEPLPNESRFDTKVALVTQVEGESLVTVIDGLVRSMGLTPIESSVPEINVFYNITDPKPFRQIWSILMTENHLDYVLLENDVIVVGDAESIAKSFKASESDNPEPEATEAQPEPIFTAVYPVNNDAEVVQGLIASVIPEAVVTAHIELQSITVQGTKAEHDLAQKTLDKFDKPREVAVVKKDVLEQRIYTLSYAKAEDLVDILTKSGTANESIASEDSTNADNGDEQAKAAPSLTDLIIAGNAAKNGDQNNAELHISADPRTNSIIITSTHDVQERFAKLIPQLDAPQKQVNVQVRIQEISTRAATNLGIDLKGGLGNFSTSILESGLEFIFDAQRSLSGLNIGAVLDTLETQGLSRRVDDTTITVVNNDTGKIQSGGKIYVSIPSAGDPIERIIDYGVMISVTPQISNNGKVTLKITAKVEQLKSRTDDAQFVDISSNNIESSVTIESGQTILLGGLFQNKVTSEVKGIPILSSIPLIGSAFSHTSNEEKNTQLLLIVTADIVE